MMEEVYANVDSVKPADRRPSAHHSGVRRFHAALLCLLLLTGFLMAGLIILSVHCESRSRERDMLNASLTNMTRQLESLQRFYKQEKSCPAGWTLFASACYFLSGKTGSWAEGGKDCTDRGAHLVVVDSAKEQEFLFGFTKKNTWLGLTDKDVEGSWKWIDGTPLILASWETNQPDSGGGDPVWGDEDCAHMTEENQKWNDLSCDAALHWICEKTA